MTSDPIISLPSEGVMGQAMKALSVNQQAFVHAFLEMGGRPGKATECAKLAGYGPAPGSIRVAAHRLMHTDKVIAAIKEETQKRLTAAVALGASAIIEMADDPTNKNRLAAATALLDRGGMQLVQKHENVVIHEDSRSVKELQANILGLLHKHGLPIPPQLEKPIDGEFVEVNPNDISDMFE